MFFLSFVFVFFCVFAWMGQTVNKIRDPYSRSLSAIAAASASQTSGLLRSILWIKRGDRATARGRQAIIIFLMGRTRALMSPPRPSLFLRPFPARMGPIRIRRAPQRLCGVRIGCIVVIHKCLCLGAQRFRTLSSSKGTKKTYLCLLYCLVGNTSAAIM